MFYSLKVLMTYWNMSAIEVEDTMDQFQKKSLASSEFDPTLQTLVFTMNSFIFGFYVAQLENEKVCNLTYFFNCLT